MTGPNSLSAWDLLGIAPDAVDPRSQAPEVPVEMREWLIRGETIADDQAEYGLTVFVRADDVHEIIRAYLVANGLPVPPIAGRPDCGHPDCACCRYHTTCVDGCGNCSTPAPIHHSYEDGETE